MGILQKFWKNFKEVKFVKNVWNIEERFRFLFFKLIGLL